jgi:hypothetical protein
VDQENKDINEEADGGKRNLKETEIILREWKTVITTQMHFNEMILRARTTGVSVVMAVYGAAAFAIGQYPARFFKVFGSESHVSTAIIAFGILLLIAIFIVDFFYYYDLLLGSVDHGKEIDKAYHDRLIDGIRLFGLTTAISDKVSQFRAGLCIFVFYGIPFFVGIISLIYMSFYYYP